MPRRAIVVPFLAALAVACASVPPPATRSPQNPAHPDAPESATPPLSPTLMTEPEPGLASPEAIAGAHAMHQGHGQAAAPPAQAATRTEAPYTCPMHPDVKAEAPGECPICGMTLARKKPEAPRP